MTGNKEILFYYAIDADEVGKQLEKLLLNNKEVEVAAFSKDILNSVSLVEGYLREQGVEIVFSGGDNILAKCERNININLSLPAIGNITWSVGVGITIEKATLALKKAKGLGRNRIEFF